MGSHMVPLYRGGVIPQWVGCAGYHRPDLLLPTARRANGGTHPIPQLLLFPTADLQWSDPTVYRFVAEPFPLQCVGSVPPYFMAMLPENGFPLLQIFSKN